VIALVELVAGIEMNVRYLLRQFEPKGRLAGGVIGEETKNVRPAQQGLTRTSDDGSSGGGRSKPAKETVAGSSALAGMPMAEASWACASPRWRSASCAARRVWSSATAPA